MLDWLPRWAAWRVILRMPRASKANLVLNCKWPWSPLATNRFVILAMLAQNSP
jgi:hypothetical protein